MIRIERYSRPRRKRWDWSGTVAEGGRRRLWVVYGFLLG